MTKKEEAIREAGNKETPEEALSYVWDAALREVTKIANERTYCDVSGDCIHKDRIHNKTTIHDDLKRLRGKE